MNVMNEKKMLNWQNPKRQKKNDRMKYFAKESDCKFEKRRRSMLKKRSPN